MYLRGVGAFRIGMSLDAVRSAIGDRGARLEGVEPDEVDDCSYLLSRSTPAGIGLMFAHGRVVRIDITAPGIRTASGIGIGSTETDVKRAYGSRITSQRHKYTDGHYLVYTPVDPPDNDLRLLFETDGRRVVKYRTGRADAVSLVEGCA